MDNQAQITASAKSLKKNDGKKQNRVKGLPKLEDAIWAGQKNKSKECTLILTEGDSAKAMAMAGMSIVGRQKYGVFPLKGKILNTELRKPYWKGSEKQVN